MTKIPNLSIQLVHIQGPLKGEIQDLGDAEIGIGRHPDCQVCFPKEMTTISRVHARIIREGNRFKVVDQSTNGTYVNGQRVAEAYLKDGDVLMFSEGGPKASFLTQSGAMAPEPAIPPASAPRTVTATSSTMKPLTTPPVPRTPPPVASQPAPIATPAPAPQPAPPVSAAPVKAPFAIQYGPTLKSFQTLPIVIGSGPACDFVITHPKINDRHAQIFFASDQYWIKDLTGRATILINSRPIHDQAALEPDMQLALSESGPKFRFIGGGRLAEVDDPLPEMPTPSPPPPQEPPPTGAKSETLGEKAGNLFKKFFT